MANQGQRQDAIKQQSGNLAQPDPSVSVSTILVPQGAEYSAVCRGLRRIAQPPRVVAIPAGPKPSSQFLRQWLDHQASDRRQPQAILLMGLCGSLTARLRVADAVLYEMCSAGNRSGAKENDAICDPALTDWIGQRLQGRAERVKGVSCDRIICTAIEKQQLGRQSDAAVVDMEGWTTLTCLKQANLPGAILRVISDDCHHNLPNLNSVLDSNGNLTPRNLAMAMVRRPGPALHLIRGSLRGLAQLQTLTRQLFEYENEMLLR